MRAVRGGSAVVVGTLVIVLGVMGRVAQADPTGSLTYRALAGTGAASTGLTFDALANDASALAVGGVQQVGSYGAVGGPITTKDPAVSPNCQGLPRPAEAAPGRAALVDQILGPDGCLQFARGGVLDLTSTPVQLTYIPFAREQVSFAISRTSNIVRNRTLDRLREYYNCINAGTLHPMLPAVGSDLRAFWIGLVYPGGVLPDTVPSCVQNGVDEFGAPIPENDGTLVNDNELVPYAVTKWGTQASGIEPERRGYTTVGQIDSKNPFSAGATVQRDLYVVIPTDKESVEPWKTVFVGAGSKICSAAASAIVTRYGYLPAPGCGVITSRTPA